MSKQTLYCPLGKDYSILTVEEERRYLISYKFSNDEKIRQKCKDELIYHNMGLIYKIILEAVNKNPRLDPNELISYGVEGMIIALDRFDESLGWRFTTYAYNWVFKQVQVGIHETALIKLPEYIHDGISKFSKERNRLKALLDREPTYKPFSIDAIDDDEKEMCMSELEEVLVYGNKQIMTPSTYKAVVEAWEAQNMVSLNSAVYDGEGKKTEIQDYFEDAEEEKRRRNNDAKKTIQAELENLRNYYKDRGDNGDLIAKIFEMKLESTPVSEICKTLKIDRTKERYLESKGAEFLSKSQGLKYLFSKMNL